MLILANPIYDVAFKALLNDEEIARELVSRVIGRQVVSLHLSSQEVPIRSMALGERTITLFRMDFSAQVRDENGRETKVLIEIQKAKLPEDIGRFRHYLGGQYMKPSPALVPPNTAEPKSVYLPIFTIYLLNFELNPKLPALVAVRRSYHNASTDQPLELSVRDEFIESLTHDSFVVQIPRLPERPTNRLERTFSLFNQRLTRAGDRRHLEMNENDAMGDPLLERMVRALHKLGADPEAAAIMEGEDILLADIERSMRKLEEQIAETAAERDVALREKAEERRQKEEERRLKEEERRQKEDAQALLRKALQRLIAKGFSEAEAREILDHS